MALQMPYTDVRGVVYAASYWVLQIILLRALQTTASVTFCGFATSTDVSMQPVAVRTYNLTSAQYASTFGNAALTQEQIVEALYALASADSFFQGATQVL